MIRGRQIIVTDAVIAKVFGLSVEWPVWANKRLKLQDAIAVFKEWVASPRDAIWWRKLSAALSLIEEEAEAQNL